MMAELETWRPEYIIDYTPTGDTTQVALLKGAHKELQKIYKHLNELQENLDATTTININGVVESLDDLPETNTVGLLYLVGSDLYMWTGEEWGQMYLSTAQEATEHVHGVVRLGMVKVGSIDGVFGAVPSQFNAVTENILSAYNSSSLRSIPQGGIIIWTKPLDQIPTGWALCDGTQGTPNLNNRIIRSAANLSAANKTGGADTATITAQSVLPHTHSFAGTSSFGAHTHSFSGATSTNAGSHSHSGTASGYTGSVGDHTHTTGFAGGLDRNGRVAYTPGSSYMMVSDSDGAVEYYPDKTAGVHTHNVTVKVTTSSATTSHTHSVSGSTSSVSAGTVTINSTTQGPSTAGSSKSINKIPGYVGVYYIMKL